MNHKMAAKHKIASLVGGANHKLLSIAVIHNCPMMIVNVNNQHQGSPM